MQFLEDQWVFQKQVYLDCNDDCFDVEDFEPDYISQIDLENNLSNLDLKIKEMSQRSI